MPGHNKLPNISDKERNKILQHKQFKSWQKLGWVTVVQQAEDIPAPKPAEDLSGALADLNISQAKDVIKACEDEDLLNIWAAKDDRKGIKDLIEDRLNDLVSQGDDEIVE